MTFFVLLTARLAQCRYAGELDATLVRSGCQLSADQVVALRDGDTVPVGDIQLTALHTPGHTPGSTCFTVPLSNCSSSSVVFTGDVVFCVGCGRTDMPGGNKSAMWTSVQRIKSLPDDTLVMPGHDYGGGSSTIGQLKRLNPYLRAATESEFRQM